MFVRLCGSSGGTLYVRLHLANRHMDHSVALTFTSPGNKARGCFSPRTIFLLFYFTVWRRLARLYTVKVTNLNSEPGLLFP